MAYTYIEYGGGDPLAAPFDTTAAMAEINERMMNGGTLAEALERLRERGMDGRRGLSELRRELARRRAEARGRGDLDGTLQKVKEMLEQAVTAERDALMPLQEEAARMAEMELATLPSDPARAVKALESYDWQSEEASALYDELKEMLRRETVKSRLPKQAGGDVSTPEGRQALKDMLADLNEMLSAHSKGEETDLEGFLDKHAEFFPDRPESVDDLVEQLARRQRAAERLLASLTPEQRDQMAALMAQAMEDMDLASEMSRLDSQLASLRPDLVRRRQRGERGIGGERGLGLGEATDLLDELAELDELGDSLDGGYASDLEDIDLDAVADHLGRDAVDDIKALQQLERELTRQGMVTSRNGKLELTPSAVRQLGNQALKAVFAQMKEGGRGSHDVELSGSAGELTGASRAWRFGDEQAWDVPSTLTKAASRPRRADGRLDLRVDDVTVAETESRSGACVCLLVDMSFSMVLNDTWATAMQTALALHTLVTTKFPQDTVHLIGFNDLAREMQPRDLMGLTFDRIQGTNLQHALHLAGRCLAKRPDAEPVVLVITDGEPTAHLMRDGHAYFSWPPEPETIALTVAEVDRLTRRGATINVFMLGEEPRLKRFVDGVAKRNGGRVFSPSPERLGAFVVSDYLASRAKRR